MRVERVLVTVDHPYGSAGVVADATGELWLAGLVDHPGTLIEGFAPAREGVEHVIVHGGRLPPGATDAVVIDAAGRENDAAVGNGAWVAVTDDFAWFEDLPVRLTGSGGEVIARPPEAGWERRPLGDAVDACPACGACEWDLATRRDPDEGHEWRKVVCRRCGHEVHVGGFVREEIDEDADAELVARQMREFEEEHLREKQRFLRGVDFPVYAAPGRRAELEGWGSSGRTPTDVTVLHGTRDEGPWLTVESKQEEFFHRSEAAEARAALEVAFELGPWPELSEPALSLWLDSRRRERLRAVAQAELTRRDLRVDGEPIPFTAVTKGTRWAAVGRLGTRRSITLAADGIPIDDVELVALDDPLSLASPAT